MRAGTSGCCWLIGVIVLVGPSTSIRSQQVGLPLDRQSTECTVDTIAANVPSDTTVVGAMRVAATSGVPAHCQVDAQVATPGNTVNVRLRLPSAWNGKFLFHGVGGYAGSVEPAPPSATSMNNMLPGLLRGYAVASTDTGHQGGGTDASWALDNRAKEIDYGHRGTHVATVAGKALTSAYYGAPPRLSYFAGCSNGGRMALNAAQRYPEDFDGIIAGAPAIGTTRINRAMAYQVMLASSDAYIPAAKLEVVSRAVTAACDEADGLADGLVSNPPACRFEPETLVCRSGDGPDCLTAGQADTLTQLYTGFTTTDGRVRTHGFPVGHEAGASGWAAWIVGREAPERQADGTLTFTAARPAGFAFLEQYLRFLAFEQDQPAYDWRRFDFDRDVASLETMNAIQNPSADLGAFRARGGRLLMYHGWADPALSAYSTIDYYDQVVSTVGGRANADGFTRLFLAPGMHHCGGGPGPSVVTSEAIRALEAWVEEGRAPDSLPAAHTNAGGVVDRTRPLCPWPQVARYTGTGSIDDAANFTCVAP